MSGIDLLRTCIRQIRLGIQPVRGLTVTTRSRITGYNSGKSGNWSDSPSCRLFSDICCNHDITLLGHHGSESHPKDRPRCSITAWEVHRMKRPRLGMLFVGITSVAPSQPCQLLHPIASL